MVTPLLGAVVYDVLQAVKDPMFFSASDASRKKDVKSALKDYPEAIIAYTATASEKTFTEDAHDILEILGASGSVIAEASRLEESKNGLFTAFLDSLAELKQYRGKSTQLAALIESFETAGKNYQRVFDRELQSLLLVSRGQDSPIIQIATDAELDKANLPGVPSVTVERPLLGGARMFYEGKLTDDSWRARLTNVLAAVSRL